MMSRAVVLIMVVSSVLFQAHSQITRWQVTHGSSVGLSDWCRIVSSNFKVTLHPFGVDVEEEAVIEAQRSNNSFFGDSTTLEITGGFYMTPGTTVRSMLLWNGKTILKAKLKEKAIANEQYEKVVDRDKPRVVPRDPALIEYAGNGYYRFKIYPVALGESRKIRILYTIPRSTMNSGYGCDIRPAFLFGCSQNLLSTIPVKVQVDRSVKSTCYIDNGGVRREIKPGSIYMLGSESWYVAATGEKKVLRISTDAPDSSWSDKFVVESPSAKGTYIALTLSVDAVLGRLIDDAAFKAAIAAEAPRELLASKDDFVEKVLAAYKESLIVEAVIMIGDNSYVLDGNKKGCILAMVKTEQGSNQKVQWNIYLRSGKLLATIDEVVPYAEAGAYTSLVPLLWAAKYTLMDRSGSLGGVFGFVDEKMSLLALEEDVLASDIANEVVTEGVPVLLPSEIYPGSANAPQLPKESVIFESLTGTTSAPADRLMTVLTLTIKGNVLQIVSGELLKVKVCTVQLFDLHGRLIFSSERLVPSGNQLSIALPVSLKGRFVVRISGGGINLQRQITLMGK